MCNGHRTDACRGSTEVPRQGCHAYQFIRCRETDGHDALSRTAGRGIGSQPGHSSAESQQLPEIWQDSSAPSQPTQTTLTADSERDHPKLASNRPNTIGGEGPFDIPRPAVGPFSSQQARAHQRAWAKHLNIAIDHKNSLGMRLVLIPPGTFMMGSRPDQVNAARVTADQRPSGPGDEDGTSLGRELPQHLVTLNNPFLLGAAEVTLGRFRRFVEASKYVTDAEKYNSGPDKDHTHWSKSSHDWRHPGYDSSDDSPVTHVTWNDAVSFCNWLSRREKLKPCYEKAAKGGWILLAAGEGYRLPSEAEWEYACRAGTTTLFSFGDDAAQLDGFGWYGKRFRSPPSTSQLEESQSIWIARYARQRCRMVPRLVRLECIQDRVSRDKSVWPRFGQGTFFAGRFLA